MPIDLEGLDLPTLAALAGAAASREVQRRLEETGFGGLRESYGYVVQHLIEGTPTVGELADALGVTQQAASKTVAEMEQRGIAERFVDERDGRVRRVRLSPLGNEAVDAARRARADLERQVGATEAELAAARTVLIRLLTVSGGTEAVRARRVPQPD